MDMSITGMHASRMPLRAGPNSGGNGTGVKQWLVRYIDDYLAAAGIQVGGIEMQMVQPGFLDSGGRGDLDEIAF